MKIQAEEKEYRKSRNRRKERKKGCLGSITRGMKNVLLLIICIIIFSMLISEITGTTDKEAPVSRASTQEAPANHASTPAPTAEPATLQDWAESVAKSVYISNKLISVSCEQVDGEDAPMITIYAQYPDTFLRDNDERMGAFLFNAMNVTWKLADLAREGKIEYGSVSIHGRTTFLDKYGNELEGDAASIRIKASEAAKVNWSYSTFTGDMLPGIAVSFGIQPIIRDGLSAQYYATIRK